MLYSDFLASVDNCLGPEAIRRGLESFRDQHTRNCLVDLQRYIPSFRLGNVTTYQMGDLTVESKAMIGALPQGAKAKAFYIYSTGPNDDPNCKRYRLDYYPWSKRQDIVCGRLDFRTWWGGCCWGVGGCAAPNPPPVDPANPNPWSWCESRAYVYSISPHLDSFVIYPPLNSFSALKLVWDGFKAKFNPTDVVPYPEEASEAVAAYVLWKTHRLIDKNIPLAQQDQQDYLNARRALIREWRDNQQTDGQDDEYANNLVPPPGESLVSAGAQAVPLLQNITQIAGTTANSLQAISTVGLTTNGPLMVMLIIGGLTQFWTVKQGADATDVPNGICQAGDFATTGNVWYQSQP